MNLHATVCKQVFFRDFKVMGLMTSFVLLEFLTEKGCVKVRDKGEYRAAHIKLYATDQLK